MLTLGALIGALFGGPVLAYGRWNSLIIANICIIFGTCLSLIPLFSFLLIGKFISMHVNIQKVNPALTFSNKSYICILYNHNVC